MSSNHFRSFVPIRVDWRSGVPRVDWCDADGLDFTDPFFDQTIERRLRNPFALTFRPETSIDTLVEYADTHGRGDPTGFIFHVSRCGSTLLAQMLAAVPRTVVMSEASPIDSLLGASRRVANLDDETRARWFRAMVLALGGSVRPYIVKFEVSSTTELAFVRRVFPNVPVVFLYRDPADVVVSQMRTPSFPMMGEGGGHGPEDHAARALAPAYEAGLQHRGDPQVVLVDYTQLPEFGWGALLSHFGMSLSTEDVALMRTAAGADAKAPERRFVPDRADKAAAVTPAIRQAVIDWLQASFEALEVARRAQNHRNVSSATTGQ